jgi:alpha-beta hydrolase superfamily lysophospholipase
LPEIAASVSIKEHTAGDGYRWRYRHYPAVGEARGHVVCIHGIQSHGGWYQKSCTLLAQAGFHVYFLDRRGAGLNEQDRGDAPGFRRLVDDLAEFLETLSTLPIFMMAISWGGKLATALQKRHPGRVNGLVLACPGFCPKVRPPLMQRLGILWSRLVAPRRFFPVPLSDPALFTASPRWQQFIREDPLSLRQATARLLLESVRLDGYLRFVPRHVKVPVLVLLAENDRIIDNPRTRRYVERFASPDKKVIEYAGAHHTLEFEPDPERFIHDVQHWLEQHATALGPRRPEATP